MNSIETEYSFLAPTWKLPSVGMSSYYGLSYTPTTSRNFPDASNSKYIPPNSTARQNFSQQGPGRGGEGARSIQPPPNRRSVDEFRINDYSNDILNINDQLDSRGTNNPPPPHQSNQKRVQIVDHNRQTPSVDYISERESHNSYSPDLNSSGQKTRSRRDVHDDNKSDSTRANNFNVHDYLYGLSAPDPGSYVSAYKNQRRRIEDEKFHRKTFVNEYKTFTKNGGFGPAFGNKDLHTYEERVEAEKKRRIYAQQVRENNQYKIEEHKRMQNNNGQPRNRTQILQQGKLRHPAAVRSHFLSAQEVREFERRIKREHDANCKCSLHAINPQHSSA